jgi:ABC-type enterochelin transport system ATPase subunit
VNIIDFNCRNRNLASQHNVAQVLCISTKATFLEAKLNALLLKTLKHMAKVLRVLLKDLIVDTYVVKADYNELV